MSSLQRNIRLFYLSNLFLGLRFIGAIWILFYTQYISFEQLSFLEVISVVMGLFFELPTGALADVIGRKWTVALGHFIAGLCCVLTGFSHTFLYFLIGYSVGGVGVALASGADSSLLYDTLKEQKKENQFAKIWGNGMTFFRLSIIIAMLLGQYMYQFWTGLPYVVLGITYFGAGIVYLFMIEPRIDSEKFTLRSYFRQLHHGFRETCKDQATRLYSLFFVVMAGIELLLLYFYYAAYLGWLGYNEHSIGIIYAILAAVRLVIAFFTQEIEQRWPEKVLVKWLPLLIGLTLLPSFWQNVWVGTALMFVHYSLFALRYTSLIHFAHQRFSSRNRASALSTLSMGVNLIYAVVILGASKVIGLHNAGWMLSILGGVLIVVALPLGLKVAEKGVEVRM